MSPSSTSSSDPPEADSHDPGAAAAAPAGAGDAPAGTTATAAGAGTSRAGKRALVLCLGILLLLEFGAARRDWLWRLDPRRPVGILLAVEDEIIADTADIRVVAVGSSVMRDAFLPRTFEAAAGLPAGSVLNTSLPNATPYDFVLLYQRNRERLAGARLLLVGIEDWFFYEESGVSERYHRWASLRDRLADYDGSARLPVLVSWLWKTYAARQAFALDGIAAALSGERAEVIGPDGRTRWRPQEQAGGPQLFDLRSYEARLRERQWRERQVRYLSRLLELAAEDGIPVLVVRMPMRAAAFEMRRDVDPDAEARLQRALREAGADGATARLLDVPTGADAGLAEADFLDERHLGTRGAQVFTRYLAAQAAAAYVLR